MSIACPDESPAGRHPNADCGWSYLFTSYTHEHANLTSQRSRFAAVLALRLFAGMGYESIAQQLGINSAGQAHRLYKRAVEDFRNWAGQPRLTAQELRAVLAGEATPYPATRRTQEIANKPMPL